MAGWNIDELESKLLYREEDKIGIEAEIRKISGNRNIGLHSDECKKGLVAGHLEVDGERWPCGDVGPLGMDGMVRIVSLFEIGSVLGFCETCSAFYRLEAEPAGKVLNKWFTAEEAYEALPWNEASCIELRLADEKA